MPKDEWACENRRIASRRNPGGKRHASNLVLPSPRTIPRGASVLIRREGSVEDFKPYVMKRKVTFVRYVAETKKAFLVDKLGFQIWVSRKLLVLK